MPRKKAEDITRSYQRSCRKPDQGRSALRLYGTRAIAALKTLCEERLKGRYDLEVIDIFQQPALACGEQIIATRPWSDNCLRHCAGSSAK